MLPALPFLMASRESAGLTRGIFAMTERAPLAGCCLTTSDRRYRLRIQLVNATRSLNISAGVWKPSVLRGLWFNCLAIALS